MRRREATGAILLAGGLGLGAGAALTREPALPRAPVATPPGARAPSPAFLAAPHEARPLATVLPAASGEAPSTLPAGWSRAAACAAADERAALERAWAEESAERRRRERIREADLASARGWVAALRAVARLGPRSPEQRLAEVVAAFERASDPVARQNLVALSALAGPPALATPWLRGLWRSGAAADAEDALCALAFLGDPEAGAAFEALARTPAPVEARRLVDRWSDHEALGEAGERELLRSYRCLELLDGDPYFEFTPHVVRLEWTPRPALHTERRRALLQSWLARWPGHPGSDDVALRLSRLHEARGERVLAATWAARAAALPDQDVTPRATRELARLVEVVLEPGELAALVAALGPGDPGRELARYAQARRTAARDGLGAGLSLVALLARTAPDDALAAAWRLRWSSPPPRGLDGGQAPLPRTDPLRRVEGAPPAPTPGAAFMDVPAGWGGRPGDAEARLRPSVEAVRLDVARVAAQLRAWETLAELERRAGAATGDARAELVYKQAAVWFHDPRVLFPAYGARDLSFTWDMVGGRADRAASGERLGERFDAESHALLRALTLFARLEAEHPGWAGLDRVLFSEGLAWRRLVDDRPWEVTDERGGARKRDAIRAAARCFEACAARFPKSPLADDARRAATWWRTAHREAF